jgi:hypothetical protein
MAEPQAPRLELPFFAPDCTELKAWSNGRRVANWPGRYAAYIAAERRDRVADVSDCVLISRRNCRFRLPETTSKRKK